MAARVYSITVPSPAPLWSAAKRFSEWHCLRFASAVGTVAGGAIGAACGSSAAESRNKPDSELRYMAVYACRGALIGATAPLSLPLLVPYYAICASLPK